MIARFQRNNEESSAYGEQRDCTVRALATASGMSYLQAHNTLSRAGRRSGHGFRLVSWLCSQTYINWRRVRPALDEVGHPKTVGQLLKLNLPGRFIITVRGHAFAVIDGIEHDNSPNSPRKRIKTLWKFEERRTQ